MFEFDIKKKAEVYLINEQFDTRYYSIEYPDLNIPLSALVDHYCTKGWYEGRNPHANFDTVSYIYEHQDVGIAGINPFYHYLGQGIHEGRQVRPGVTPSLCTLSLFGYPLRDWVSILAPLVDAEYYWSQLSRFPLSSEINPVAHFAYRGWREGFSPSRNCRVADLIEQYPIVREILVNPLLVHLEGNAGGFVMIRNELVPVEVPADSAGKKDAAPPIESTTKGTSLTSKDPQRLSTALPSDDEALTLIGSEFSNEYYLATYIDLAQAGVDPLLHYYRTGWREGRNPNANFNTAYYLGINEDVRNTGVNPFWHYLAEGRAQGRRGCPAGGYRRRIIEAAVEPGWRSAMYSKDASAPMQKRALTRLISSRLKQRSGWIMSLSHDSYTEVIGGTQILISDEQQEFNRQGRGYIHLSPRDPSLTLVDEEDFIVRLTVDGERVGIARAADLCDVLERTRGTLPEADLFTVHCLLGFDAVSVCRLWSAVKAQRSFYWVHDYSSICEGFNLLRNDVEFCGAPINGSVACGICVYGRTRAAHIDRLNSVFEHCRFEVVAPSECALALWEQASALPRQALRVQPHWALETRSRRTSRSKQGLRRPLLKGNLQKPVSVAFIGSTTPHKGWPIFEELAAAVQGDRRYRLFHFVERGSATLPGVEVVPTEVSATDRNATVDLLTTYAIDLVAILSPWPETFSFVAHEAALSGANIVCLEASGNVAALVNRLGRGVVLANADAVVEFFVSGAAVTSVRDGHRSRGDCEALRAYGSATLLEQERQ